MVVNLQWLLLKDVERKGRFATIAGSSVFSILKYSKLSYISFLLLSGFQQQCTVACSYMTILLMNKRAN